MSPLLLAPMRAEARALRRGTALTVLRTGTGPARSARAAARLAHREVVVVGVGGGLDPLLRTGTVVVASEVRAAGGTVELSEVDGLATALRAAGLDVAVGPVHSDRRLVTGRRRTALAGHALVADTESYWLLGGAVRPVACVRVVADTDHLVDPRTLLRLRSALSRLPAVARALTDWAARRDPVPPLRLLKEVR
ncbi:phosphorylase family protein [Actinocatenispora rupis]|uniref:Nucleoside phosphorylase domain-containing protein n=1 Tax=Actinocatenispora rupis TaxID=519421 RepID=A0A8J3J7Y7_9ACTN|nr:hypothetical protein [Actinocatenispora rupis]GID11802.1 hypothetical protein Aru02nite_26910 [Actinocatenispora rupis]